MLKLPLKDGWERIEIGKTPPHKTISKEEHLRHCKLKEEAEKYFENLRAIQDTFDKNGIDYI